MPPQGRDRVQDIGDLAALGISFDAGINLPVLDLQRDGQRRLRLVRISIFGHESSLFPVFHGVITIALRRVSGGEESVGFESVVSSAEVVEVGGVGGAVGPRGGVVEVASGRGWAAG